MEVEFSIDELRRLAKMYQLLNLKQSSSTCEEIKGNVKVDLRRKYSQLNNGFMRKKICVFTVITSKFRLKYTNRELQEKVPACPALQLLNLCL